MKKLFALLIAVIIGLFSATVGNADTVTVDTPTDVKIVEWSIGYSKRCGNATFKKVPSNHTFIRRVALMPIMMMMGVTYHASYTQKDGRVATKDYDRFVDAKSAVVKLKKFGYKDASVKTVLDAADKTNEEIARNSELGFIKKLCLRTGDMEYIVMPNCSFKRKLKKAGLVPFDCVMKIDAHVSENEDELYADVIANMQDITAEKYIDKKGCAWKPLLASASDKRKGTFLCIREDLYDSVHKWLVGGKDIKRIEMVVAKYLVYLGLQTSASKPMKEVFGWQFDFNRIAVIDDCEDFTKSAKDVLFVNADNTVEEKKAYKELLNLYDGIAVCFSNKLVKKPFSGRFGIMTKFLMVPVSRQEYKEMLKKYNHDGYIKQFDRTKVHIDDVDVIMMLSTYKGKDIFHTVAEWKQACIENGYGFEVCVQQHKKCLKDMPYQQGQLLKGTPADALGLVSHAAATVQKWRKPEEAAKMVGGYLGAMCEIYPALLKTRYVQKVLQERYTQRRNKMIAGKVPEVGYSVFVAPDPLALFCHIFGLPIETQIEEDECILSWAEDGQEVVLTRNPDTDGCPICMNKRSGWGCVPGVLYINPYSWIPVLLRLDYDGDHVLVITDQQVVKLFKQTYQLIDKKPITWVAPKGKKSKINNATIAEALMGSITGTQTGIHSDNITKLWNISKEDRQRLVEMFGEDVIEKMIAIETYNTNVDIDSTKNAANNTTKDIQAQKMLAELKRLMLPEFCRHSKATLEHPATDDKHWGKRCKYSGSLLDMYAKGVQNKLPEKLEVKGLESSVFCVHKLMIDAHRPTSGYAGLAEAGTMDKGTGAYCDEGVFNNIAFRHSKEWSVIIDKKDKMSYADVKNAIKDAATNEIDEFVKMQGGDIDGAYDVITRWLFIKTSGLSDNYFDIVAREWVDIFAEKALNVLCMNMGLAPENDIPDYGDEDEDAA